MNLARALSPARFLRRVVRLMLLTLHLAWGLMIAILVGGEPARHSEREWQLIGNWMGQLCRILGLRIHVSGKQAPGTVLLAANHISWHDIVVIQSLVPTGFVAKAEIRNWPLVGWMAHRGATVFIHRGKHDSFRITREAVKARLAAGQNMMIFPEGTTGNGETVLPFKSRLFEPAVDLSVPVQPVAIRYTGPGVTCRELAFVGDESFLAHLWRTLGEPYIDVRLHFGRPITSDHSERRDLARQAQNAVAGAIRQFGRPSPAPA